MAAKHEELRDGHHLIRQAAEQGEAREPAISPNQERKPISVGPVVIEIAVSEQAMGIDIPQLDFRKVVDVQLHEVAENGFVDELCATDLDVRFHGRGTAGYAAPETMSRPCSVNTTSDSAERPCLSTRPSIRQSSQIDSRGHDVCHASITSA
jgi:hypothetical protein